MAKDVILRNRTKCPDEILLPIIRAAGKAAGADIDGVVVRVNQGQRETLIRGMAHRCYRWRGIDTRGGTYSITIPKWRGVGSYRRVLWPSASGFVLAEDFYWVAFHEWVHVRDYQHELSGARLAWDRRSHRGSHDKRPEEIRAHNAEYDAKKRPLHKQTKIAIIVLGAWLEGDGPDKA